MSARLCLAIVFGLGACRREVEAVNTSAPAESNSAQIEVAPKPFGLEACAGLPFMTELAPGLQLQRFRSPVAPSMPNFDGCITILRMNPARYHLRLLTALADGGSRPADEWATRFKLLGVVNASMFQQNERSTGLMVNGVIVNNPDDNDKFGAFMAFDPKDEKFAPVAFHGRPCDGFKLSALRKRYKTIVQNYRLLDCDGSAIRWKDTKLYSAAAIGQDRRGSVTFIHARTPYTMSDFAQMLATPSLDMRAAMFVEGGPEASLFVRAGEHDIRAIGSYETGFTENDNNQKFWSLPNVIGFAARP